MSVNMYYRKSKALENMKAGEFLYAADTEKGTKAFFLATHADMNRSLKKDRNFYEHYGYLQDEDGKNIDQQTKFFIDLDYKIDGDHATIFQDKNELLETLTQSIEKFMASKGILVGRKIVLDASTDKKFSFHVIYPNTIFKNITMMKTLALDYAEAHEQFKGIFDDCVYANRCFRCINQSKLGKNNQLIGDCSIVESLLLSAQTETPITYLGEKQQLKNKVEKLSKIVESNISPMDCVKVDVKKCVIPMTRELMQDLANGLATARADSYRSWLEVLFAMKCENSNDYYDEFELFSKKSEKFDKSSVVKQWDSYDASKTNHKFTYNSLLYWVKYDNVDMYAIICEKHKLFQKEEPEMVFDKALIVDQAYLLPEKKLDKDIVSKYINKFLGDKNVKTLMIESPYNTGKTTCMTQICDKFKRILFISYRITLTHNLFGTFKNLGFKTYMDDIHADRLICQIDSLKKISLHNYDLIVIDESESALNHFSSESLKDQLRAFEILTMMCLNASKIIALDGDLNNRTKEFIKGFGEPMFIQNKIVKDKKHFKFHVSESKFNTLIDADLLSGKNIVIVTMSESQANMYYLRYSEQYRTIKYTSKTNDGDIALLADVKAIWGSQQLVIYTPCIEAGVDYDIEHFDKIYVTLSGGSTSQRGLMQMIGRVRKLKDYTVETFLKDIPAYKFAAQKDVYTFEEIKAFYRTLTDKQQTTYGLVDEVLVVKQTEEFNLFDVIQMYNEVEKKNKTPVCFLPLLIRIITRKGNTYEIVEEVKGKIEKCPNTVQETIISTQSIGEEEYECLRAKQGKKMLTEEDKYKITKFVYEQTFNMQFKTVEELKPFYNKLGVVNNARCLINPHNIVPVGTELKIKRRLKKFCEVKALMGLFGIDASQLLDMEPVKMLKGNVEAKLKEVEKACNDNKILFGLAKSPKIESYKHLVGALKTIFNKYGVNVSSERKRAGQDTKLSYCVFSFDDTIKNAIARPNKLTDWVALSNAFKAPYDEHSEDER